MIDLHPDLSTPLWHLITDQFNENASEWPGLSLHHQLLTSPLWTAFLPSTYRDLHRSVDRIKYPILSISPRDPTTSRFWRIMIPLPARDLWYLALCNKLPTEDYLHSIGRFDFSTCPLCIMAVEDKRHFLVHCPNKLYIWQLNLSTLFTLALFQFHNSSNAQRPHHPTRCALKLCSVLSLFGVDLPIHYMES